MSNAELSNGIIVGVGGLVVVFLGLVLIEIVIHFFNRYFEKKEQKKAFVQISELSKKSKPIPIPDEDLVAIVTTLELYRKIHFEQLQSEITFQHGNQPNNWKIGSVANQFSRK
jgi:hypothetical protein